MNVLVLNGGSSSVKFSVFAMTGADSEPDLLLDGELSGARTDSPSLAITKPEEIKKRSSLAKRLDPGGVIDLILRAAHDSGFEEFAAAGYRIVHPGPDIHDHVRITDGILKQLDAARAFAPLHDPEAVTMIREVMHRLPDIPHFACFDTVFHQTMPEEASTYAIPLEYRARGAKRYGFHGLSCESAVRQLRQAGALQARMVIAHLGSGCSVTAVLNGASVDTTMGLTPAGGVMMGTRPGDLDPGLLLYLLRQQKGTDSAASLEQMLNHEAGMVALTGLQNDMKAVRAAAATANGAAILALRIFTRSVRKAIGGFAWLLGGLDAVVFTGGIGEHDAATRFEVLAQSEVLMDSGRNEVHGDGVCLISASHSPAAVFVVPAKENLVIAMHVQRMADFSA